MEEKKMIRALFITRNDMFIRVLKGYFHGYGIDIIKIIEPPANLLRLATKSSKRLERHLRISSLDLIVADVTDPDYNFTGVNMVKALSKFFPEVKRMGLSDEFDPKLAKKLEKAGAHGYIFRYLCFTETMADAIKDIANGKPRFLDSTHIKESKYTR